MVNQHKCVNTALLEGLDGVVEPGRHSLTPALRAQDRLYQLFRPLVFGFSFDLSCSLQDVVDARCDVDIYVTGHYPLQVRMKDLIEPCPDFLRAANDKMAEALALMKLEGRIRNMLEVSVDVIFDMALEPRLRPATFLMPPRDDIEYIGSLDDFPEIHREEPRFLRVGHNHTKSSALVNDLKHRENKRRMVYDAPVGHCDR